jgi:uncharacterized protein YbjT (DUF2867 family)
LRACKSVSRDAAGGAGARFQPVYVGDVADAFVSALLDPHKRKQL